MVSRPHLYVLRPSLAQGGEVEEEERVASVSCTWLEVGRRPEIVE